MHASRLRYFDKIRPISHNNGAYGNCNLIFHVRGGSCSLLDGSSWLPELATGYLDVIKSSCILHVLWENFILNLIVFPRSR